MIDIIGPAENASQIFIPNVPNSLPNVAKHPSKRQEKHSKVHEIVPDRANLSSRARKYGFCLGIARLILDVEGFDGFGQRAKDVAAVVGAEQFFTCPLGVRHHA